MSALPRPALVALFALLVAASTPLLVRETRSGWHVAQGWNLLYQAATLGFNYVEHGFVRRGLGGTLIHLSGLPQLAGTVVFHLLSACALAFVACRLLAQQVASREAALVLAAVLLVLVLFWAEDAGRSDMAVAACLGVATLALLHGRPLGAAAALTVALAFHEAGFVFGLPLAAALLLDRRRLARQPRAGLAAAAALILAACLVSAALGSLPHADRPAMVESVRAKLPPHPSVDWAIYFSLSGARGMRAAICQSLRLNPNYALQLASGLLVIAVAIASLLGRDRPRCRLALLAALPPYLLLAALATDLARWSALACFNAWLLAVAAPPTVGEHPTRWLLPRLLGVAALLLLSHPGRPPHVDIPVYSPSPLLEALARRLGARRTPGADVALPICDPAWRELLAPSPPGARAPRLAAP